ncbi:MAG TPA: hypothetical protein VFC19_39140 [Candidatus Limnocylindrales bacterium]|nr:hypothetical protein [Candidatus Limnocylindrales bacterium]
MGRRDEYRGELGRRSAGDWPEYLTKESGLPGPRANLELAQAAADVADPETLDGLIASGDEYLTFCGVTGLADEKRLKAHATDDRWRIREAVAMALQRLGEKDFPRLRKIVTAWAKDGDPLVQRAAVAAICEPRLLSSPQAAKVAIETCGIVTATLKDRQKGDGRTALRKALGYGWSVAVAADPAAGLPVFQALQRNPDPDVRWIVIENSKKARLAKLLG